jgi:hypothetical protein
MRRPGRRRKQGTASAFEGSKHLINNRQGGRRRGRGGQRPQNIGGRPDGNRQDNRQRGNAAQLLEKYKAMARDAQLAGDRVQTEYYLQYADHYYRILGESRARFEEQRRQRGDGADEDEGDDEMIEADGDQQQEQDDNDRPERSERAERRPQRDRAERDDRPRRYGRDDNQEQRAQDDRGQDDRGEGNRPQRERQGNRIDRSANGDERLSPGDERIAFEALPPAIGVNDGDGGEPAEAVAKPRRARTRRPRAENGDEDIAPAA